MKYFLGAALVSVILLALTLAGCALLLTHDLHSLTGAAHSTLSNTDRATGTIADYAQAETSTLSNPKNERAIDAAIQLGAVYNGMGRLFNTQVIPRAMKTLDGLTATEQASTDLIHHQDANATASLVYINEKVLPELVKSSQALTGLEQRIGVTADEAAAVIKQSGASVDQVNKILASSTPQIQAALELVGRVASGVDATVEDFHADLHKTMANWPTIAAEIEKTTRNISRFSKISIISAIFTNIANGIIPGILH